MSTPCDICETIVSRSKNINKHKKSEKCIHIKKILDKNNEMHKKILDKKNEMHNKLLEEKNNEIKTLKADLDSKTEENIELKNTIKCLEEKYEDMKHLAEKAVTRPTNTTNNIGCNYMNIISKEPINFKDLSKKLKEKLTPENVIYRYHPLVLSLLKDGEGKYKVICTDINRKRFKILTGSGKMINDTRLNKVLGRLNNIIERERENGLSNELKEYCDNNFPDDDYKYIETLLKLPLSRNFIDYAGEQTYAKNTQA